MDDTPLTMTHVYEVQNYLIVSEDDVLDGPGTVPDRIEDTEHRPLEGAERDRFVEGLRTGLGVESAGGLSLSRMEGFFTASARARGYLRGHAFGLALQQASFAAGHARDGGFMNDATRATLRSLVEESLRPGIEAAEAALNRSPEAGEIWRLLNQEPFRSFRPRSDYRVLTLQNLERDGVLEAASLARIGALTGDLIRRGIEAAPEYGREALRSGETSGDFRAAWLVLSGLRNAAALSGAASDFTEVDALIADLETYFSTDPERLELLRDLAE